MKEAFWGVLIVMLGLFGIVVVNLFQKVTIENDRVYYVIKETTEASMYDAVDLSTYRLTGKLRMVEDKFVENLTRRFAQNVSLGNYTITIQDINETPPYVSVVVKSNVSSIKGDTFNIKNSVNGILETKYTLDELLEFLGITEDEWNSIQKGEDKNVCDMSNFGESECIPGDLKFGGFEDVSVPATNCIVDAVKENIPATATYYECECGKWKEYEEDVYTSGVKNSGDITYKWTFVKEGKLRSLNETMTRKTKLDICTTDVDVMVPKYLVDINTPLPTNLTEPSSDNSQYVACPVGGIKIPSEQVLMLHGGYIPPNATNRVLDWYKTGNALKSIDYYKGGYVSKNSYSKGKITANKIEIGDPEKSSNVEAKTSLNQTGVCKVTVWDGTIDSLKCENIEVLTGSNNGVIKYSYTPRNATKTDFTFTLSDTNIATITGNTITAKNSGTTTITMADKYTGKTTTCNLKVNSPIVNHPYSEDSNTIVIIRNEDGKQIGWAYSVDSAIAKAPNGSKIVISNSSSEIDYAKVKIVGSSQHSTKSVTINGTGITTTTTSSSSGTTVSVTDSDGKILSSQFTPPSTPIISNSVPDNSYIYYPADPGWGKGGHGCFLEGTKVMTQNGFKDINKINIGDKVLSYNVLTNKNEYKEVIEKYIHKNSKEKLYSLTINNKILKVTEAHKFYIKNNKNYDWVAASNLNVGDLVMDSNFKYYPITKISFKVIEEDIYNLEVKDNHNYYVTKDKILVHNLK